MPVASVIETGVRKTEWVEIDYTEGMKNNLTGYLPKDNYDLIDFLPLQVEKGKGHFFEVEKYFLKYKKKVFRRFIGFFLKLYCYHDLEIDYNKKEYSNPKPEKLVSLIKDAEKKDLLIQIKAGSTVFLLTGSDLYITVYSLEENRELIETIASSEGLFVRNRTL